MSGLKARDPGRRETPGKVLKDRRSPRRRGRMGTSVRQNAPEILPRVDQRAALVAPLREVRLQPRSVHLSSLHLGRVEPLVHLQDVVHEVLVRDVVLAERPLQRRGFAVGIVSVDDVDGFADEGNCPYEATSGWSSMASEAESRGVEARRIVRTKRNAGWAESKGVRWS